METIIIKGQVTATSNKKSDLNSEGSQRKSIYISSDNENLERAKEFGLTVYTSKDGDDFLIVKASNEVTLYCGEDYKKISTSINDDNFNTGDNIVDLAIMKGSKNHNDFYRLYAINVKDFSDIETVKKLNPFSGNQLDDDFTVDLVDERTLF